MRPPSSPLRGWWSHRTAGTSPSLGRFFSPSSPGPSSASGRLPSAASLKHRGPVSSKPAEAAVCGTSRAEGWPLTPSRALWTGKPVSHLPGIRHMVLLPGTLAHPKSAQSPLLVLQRLLRGPLSCSGRHAWGRGHLLTERTPQEPSLGSPWGETGSGQQLGAAPRRLGAASQGSIYTCGPPLRPPCP